MRPKYKDIIGHDDTQDVPWSSEKAKVLVLSSIFTSVRPLQPEKAPQPMDVTLLGMVTDVRPKQPLKAESPMIVTLLPMVNSISPLQFKKAYLPMDVMLLPIVSVFRVDMPLNGE